MTRDIAPERTFALVVAGGVGKRMGTDTPKQFLPLAGHPVLFHCLSLFDAHPSVGGLCVVLDPLYHDMLRGETPWNTLKIPLVLADAGAERADSVRSGLEALRGQCDAVLIHDAARPLVSSAMIDALLEHVHQGRGAIIARPIHETVKRVDESGLIEGTIDRQALWLAETPQAFLFEDILAAHESARTAGSLLTDDAQAFELVDREVAVVPTQTPNPKITQVDDLAQAEMLIRRRESEGGA
jgi:2-C-methyl-D-erythritol 4-phosphate cytidylyltransferase